MKRKYRVFLDTSVIIAAILSSTGGSRKLFRLGESGLINLMIGPMVLWECDRIVKEKSPGSLARLALFLDTGQVMVVDEATNEEIDRTLAFMSYEPDAYVLAEAISAKPDWFVTHDKTHFLSGLRSVDLPFIVGTPGDFLQMLADELASS